jgi:carbon storage regulator
LLSLARKTGQKIRIGENVVLVIREIRGRQVKIGIEAPPHVRVLREEIHEEIAEANRDAVMRADLALPAVLRLGSGARP